MADFGKWSQPGVPQKGWSCTGIEDLGEPSATCEMCENQEIRYVHYMEHPNYAESLGVGCVCAGHMEEDYEGAKKREQSLKNAAARRRRWLFRKWNVSEKGNDFIKTDGFTISVFPRDAGWGGVIIDIRTEKKHYSKRVYPTKDAAKLAAFDAMIFLKGWS